MSLRPPFAAAAFGLVAVSACVDAAVPQVEILGLSDCASDSIFPVAGIGGSHLMLGAVDGEPAIPCVVIANATGGSVFVERLDLTVDCGKNGFAADPPPAVERMNALICGQQRDIRPVLLLEDERQVAVPFPVLDRAMFAALEDWLEAMEWPADMPFAPRFLVRLRFEASVVAEVAAVESPAVAKLAG